MAFRELCDHFVHVQGRSVANVEGPLTLHPAEGRYRRLKEVTSFSISVSTSYLYFSRDSTRTIRDGRTRRINGQRNGKVCRVKKTRKSKACNLR